MSKILLPERIEFGFGLDPKAPEGCPQSMTPEDFSQWLANICLKCKEPLTREFALISLENIMLFDRKQQDYGPNNIADWGETGVLIRMSDKFARLRNLAGQKRRSRNESIEDTYRDIHNYANIALMCRKGAWPK